ncbi:MAG: hypothetical protein DMF69_23120 [Acidobacteria bacterium]|nr:MAG: hypothetical protein DMF69_23120 [Acidobacteriota bacterium]
MLIEQQTQLSSRSGQTKLHTLHAVLRGRVFDGKVEARGKTYSVVFLPNQATIVDHRLVLTGRLSFSVPGQATGYVDGVSATLMATQGGVGVSPVRRQLLAGTAQTAQTATSDQKLEQEKGPETDLQPGLHSFEPPNYDDLGRPKVEATGSLAYVGVLYFKLSPLDSKALGIPLDLSDVQLGARLAPTDDLARDLQLLFSDVVLALENKTDDTSPALAALNIALRV